MDIYLSLKKKVTVDKNTITIGDICDIKASSAFNIDEISRLTIFKRKQDSKKNIVVITIMDVISIINIKHNNITINNVGEINTVVEFLDKREHSAIKWAKIFFICLVISTGCATAIIAFHVDSQLSKVFEIYGSILGVAMVNRKYFMEVPYSLGIALGIIIFFNHIAGKKITTDPTPIEVEMAVYEEDVITTLIDNDRENKR